MNNKIIAIFVCILLIVIFGLSASGTTNNIKTYERTYVNLCDLIVPVISKNPTISNWSEQKLFASDGAAGEEFGYPVSIDGNYAIIGVPHDNDMGNNSGSAYIFKNNGTSWIEIQKLTASDGAESELFGYYLSISGDYVIIGAPYDDDMGANSGSAYIFKNNGTSWIEEQKIYASDGAADDWFGRCISMDADYAIIGAPHDDDMGNNSGSAYIFKNNGTSWIEEKKLTAIDGADDDWFGRRVSIDGNYAIIGAENNDVNGEDSGSVYIFKYDDKNWVEEAKLIASDGEVEDYFGTSVSIDGNHAIIGAALDDNSNGVDAGSVYIFEGINKPPNTPIIDGPNNGITNNEYNFTFNSTDPDDDDILEYVIDWGDGTEEVTISGPFASGEKVTSNHCWTIQKTFTIKAKAKDINGAESNWSEFEVTIPRTKTTINSLFHWLLERFPILKRLYSLIRVP